MNAETTLQKRVGGLLFYGLALLLAYFVYLIFAPFLVALAWAAVLVVVSYPVYEWLTRRMHPTSAALVCTLGVTLMLIVPSVLVMIEFGRQGVEAVQSMQFSMAAGHFTWLGDAWTHLHNRFPSVGSDDLISAAHRYTAQAAEFVAARLGTILKNTALFFFHLFVTILVMFYLYRDGDAMIERLRQVLPFESGPGDRMLGDAKELIFASVTSSLASAVVHALLGGFAFAVTGIEAPLFWGVLMGFCSFIPVVGSAIVWVPAAISLMVGGHLGRGIFLAIFCILIVGLVDNVMRPWLISGRAQMGGLLVFISVLGGISVFGLLGVVLGPIIVATTASLLDLYAPPGSDGNNRSKPGGKERKAVLE